MCGLCGFYTVAALRFPAPGGGRQSCRCLESGSLHPPQAALYRFPCTISISPPQRPIFACGKNGKAPKEKDTSYQLGKVQGSRQDPAKRSWWEGEEKVRPAYEKSPKAFFIALGLFLNLERATRLELASRYPTNRLRRFAGALPHLKFKTRFARGWRQQVLPF